MEGGFLIDTVGLGEGPDSKLRPKSLAPRLTFAVLSSPCPAHVAGGKLSEVGSGFALLSFAFGGNSVPSTQSKRERLPLSPSANTSTDI